MKPEDLSVGPIDSPADMNMKPSIIVQQQRQIQMGIYSANPLNNNNRISKTQITTTTNSKTASSNIVVTCNSQEDKQQASSSTNNNEMITTTNPAAQQFFDQNGLVLPKKILPHPINSIAVVGGHNPIIGDLNRELKFNQVRGKNVLDQKSELKKALEKLEDNKKKKKAEEERLTRRSSLELRLEERAERIAKETSQQQQSDLNAPKSSSPPGSNTTTTTCKPLANFSIKSSARR